jgi:hypothetical protein
VFSNAYASTRNPKALFIVMQNLFSKNVNGLSLILLGGVILYLVTMASDDGVISITVIGTAVVLFGLFGLLVVFSGSL